jgi:hypothetical protein
MVFPSTIKTLTQPINVVQSALASHFPFCYTPAAFSARRDGLFKESVMSGKWMFRLCMLLGVLCLARAADAAAPWNNLISLKNIDADQNQTYKVSEDNGPWMIMTSSFSGQGAEKQAQELVLELRKRYKIPAYIYFGHFDPGEAQARGIDKYGNPKKANYYKYKDSRDKEKARHPELVEVAVLAGDFSSPDDRGAQATLQTLKFAKPQCLELKEGKATNQTLTGLRWAQLQVYEAIGSDKKKYGPMRHSFIIPNPLLPPDYFNQEAVDEETVALNKDVPYSLLECPGKYTVQIATFRGNAVIKQDDIQEIEQGRKEMKTQLAVAAQKAHDLTIYLREKHYEVYQYHDRYTSIVTFGSFNSPGRTSPDGKLEMDPKIKNIIDFFRAKEPDSQFLNRLDVQSRLQAVNSSKLGSQTVSVQPFSIQIKKDPDEFIPCDVQPLVMRVPKRAFSSAFSREE